MSTSSPLMLAWIFLVKLVATLFFLVLWKWVQMKLVIASDVLSQQRPQCKKIRQRKKIDTGNKVSGQKTVAYTGNQFA